MNIRQMQQSDLQQVLEVQRQTFTEDLRESYDVFINRLERFGDHFLVLEDGKKIVGYAIAFPWLFGDSPVNNENFPLVLPAPTCFYLHDIAVLEAYQGKGLGQALLERVEQKARSLGFDQLSLMSVSQSGQYWDEAGYKTVKVSKEKQEKIIKSFLEK